MGISTAIAPSCLDGEVFFGKKSPPAQEVTLMPSGVQINREHFSGNAFDKR